MFRKCCKVMWCLLLGGILAGSATAQVDPFGALDSLIIDSVVAGPGEDVPLRFTVFNDEPLGSLSFPITYDTALLSLLSISYTDSRAEHLGTKIITPGEILQINGHFVVALIQVFEDPVPPGKGLIFTALFRLSDSAQVGQVAVIDSLFFPPGGELIFVEEQSSTIIRPFFKQGKIVVGATNRAPLFTVLPDQHVLEGDSLDLTVNVVDPDDDSLILAITSKPTGATFTDNGDGSARFVWVPEFVGPNSADGSPAVVRFWASDGDRSAELQINIEIVNRNRPPAITAPDSISVEAGDQMQFSLTAFDPDFEPITWSWSGLPAGAVFDGNNPGHLSWTTTIIDTGSFEMQFVAADPQGLADTVNLNASIIAVSLFTLGIDSVAAYPGENTDFNIILDNKLPIGSFNLLLHYDPSALSLLSMSNVGTRSESFEYFTVQDGYDDVEGNVRIIGIADFGGGAPNLSPGDGPIATGRLRISGNLAYAGMSLPILFQFLDMPINIDNTLTDSIGTKIEQTEITYNEGQLSIFNIGQIRIGDINLNGLPGEIGDVIYFTNYFINPGLYSFNALQYANSDVNRDNIAATVSDLVALINLVVTGGSPAKVSLIEPDSAEGMIDTGGDVITISLQTDQEIGGVYIEFEVDGPLGTNAITPLSDNMTFQYRQDGSLVKVLIYSLVGETMPSGRNELVAISASDNVRINRIELGDADGRHIPVAMRTGAVELPSNYALEQNYPNPFNPETSIEFSLPEGAVVELVIYDVLGRQVRRLASGEYTAGQHAIMWDGRDENRNQVASGVYLYRLQAGNHSFTRKMMLLK